MTGITLDAGALLAFERGHRRMDLIVDEAQEQGYLLAVPAGVLAQVWRSGRRQAALARLLNSPQVEVVSLDPHSARLAGQLCGLTRTSDVIDATVVVVAQGRGHRVVTSDAADLRRLDPSLRLIEI